MPGSPLHGLSRVGAGARALGIRVHPAAGAAALAISFGTHYAADRRIPGKGLLERIATKTGKGGFYKLADFMNGRLPPRLSLHY
ncbi:hypothetical protein [Streptomyces sp. NPDC052721]|uniref:hypothetical protein n=1 Tax=Streptomyces sp. NPDC052721 TaxID=3154955 RepID=UPI0034149D64